MKIDEIIKGLKETILICDSVYCYDRKKYIDGAIDRLHKYELMQANYCKRLQDDLKAALTELQLEIEEKSWGKQFDGLEKAVDMVDVNMIIQQKINALKENKNGNDN